MAARWGVESEPGRGAMFWFTLPLSDHEPISRQVRRAREAKQPTRSIVTPDVHLETPVTPSAVSGAATILVVDDEPVNLQVLVNQLGRLDYHVVTALSGPDAMDLMERGLRPDLVLLDVMMPIMSGYDVCRKLREEFSATELPVVMLTAKTRTTDVVAGLQVGANDYVTKPFSSDELVVRIRTHLQLAKVNSAIARFVPADFLRLLGRDSLVEVRLGDNIERVMSVLFSDIRGFTTISEKLTPEANFRFINSYLGHMEPVIVRNRGFIDKYIGDAIMALFDNRADDAVRAGLGMLQVLNGLNPARIAAGEYPLRVGIGINTGRLMLGTVGGEHHMNSTVVSDAVNVASRMEGLTKRYNAGIIISEETMKALADPGIYRIRRLDSVRVHGKEDPVTVYEVYDADPPDQVEGKMRTQQIFEEAVALFHGREIGKAQRLFERCLALHPTEPASQQYLDRCRKIQMQFMGMEY